MQCPHQTRHSLSVPGVARQTAMPLARWAEHRPKTAAGLARLRAAKMKHGRYSAEHRTLLLLLHAYQRNEVPRPRARSELLRRAREPLSCDVVNHLREVVERDLKEKEQRRLDRWCHSAG